MYMNNLMANNGHKKLQLWMFVAPDHWCLRNRVNFIIPYCFSL